MLKTTVYIVRHRESEKNLLEIHHSHGVDKYPLSQKGHKQAGDLVGVFSQKTIDVIYTSPFLRCRETITPLALVSGLVPIIDERISELNVGDLNETPWRLSWKPDRRLTDVPIGDRGESLIDCRDRVRGFLDDVLRKHAGKSILVCTHGEPGLFAKQYFLGFDYDSPEKDSLYPAKDGYDEFTLEDNFPIRHSIYGNNTI